MSENLEQQNTLTGVQDTDLMYLWRPALSGKARSNQITIANLASGLAPKVALKVSMNMHLEVPQAKKYTLIWRSPYTFDIDNIQIASGAGTATADVKINATSVTSLNAVAVSTSNNNVNATGANSVAVNDEVSITLSSLSSVSDIVFTLSGTRT